jgi:hypothetical protein
MLLGAVFEKSFASEFPHDNPELSDGVAWVCTSVCGVPQPQHTGQTLRPERAEPALKARPLARITPLRAPAPPEPETAFDRFVLAMVRVALSTSATLVAAELPLILREGRLRVSTLGAEATRALQARGYLLPEASAASEAFVTAQSAWRDVLTGASSDFGSCGSSTLDEWGAALLSALLARPAGRTEELKRALRAEGVAAFGMREAA